MKDSTKIKLINSLIETVGHFYELKPIAGNYKSKHLKGFCEGIAYTLVQMDILSSDEATEILKGLGKKRSLKKRSLKKSNGYEDENLDIPTVFRKKDKLLK